VFFSRSFSIKNWMPWREITKTNDVGLEELEAGGRAEATMGADPRHGASIS
jgi:hypothetical protein